MVVALPPGRVGVDLVLWDPVIRAALTVLVVSCCGCGGCVYVPPLWNADPEAAAELQSGISSPGDVRAAFGAADDLDLPRFKVYSAHHDLGLIAYAIPYATAGAETIQQRSFRIAARFDAQGRLERLEGVACGSGLTFSQSVHEVALVESRHKALFGDRPLAFAQVAVSDDGSFAALDEDDRLWLCSRWGAVSQTFDVEATVRGPFEDLAISPDGRFVGIAGRDVAVWNARTGEVVFSTEGRPGENGRYTRVALAVPSSHDAVIAAGDRAGMVRVWTLAPDEARASFDVDAGRGIRGLTVTRDGSRVAASTQSRDEVVVWDVATGADIARVPIRRRKATDIALLDRGGHRLAVVYASHVEIHRLASLPGGDAKLDDVLPIPPGGSGGRPCVSTDRNGTMLAIFRRVGARQGDGLLLNTRSRTIARTAAWGKDMDLDIRRGDFVAATRDGVQAIIVGPGESLHFDPAWLER